MQAYPSPTSYVRAPVALDHAAGKAGWHWQDWGAVDCTVTYCEVLIGTYWYLLVLWNTLRPVHIEWTGGLLTVLSRVQHMVKVLLGTLRYFEVLWGLFTIEKTGGCWLCRPTHGLIAIPASTQGSHLNLDVLEVFPIILLNIYQIDTSFSSEQLCILMKLFI